MKIIIVLLVALCCIAAAAQDKPQPEPTLEETLTWLKDNLPSKASYIGAFRTLDWIERVAEVEIDRCNVRWRTEQETSASRRKEGDRFSLADLDAANVALSTSQHTPPMFVLTLNAKDGRKVIKRVSLRETPMLRPSVMEYFTESVRLSFQDEATRERFQKAFTHAIKLCASPKKEPF